jgi:predicted dehydrogenase
VRIGHIGLGVQGGSLARYTGAHPEISIVAVCDVYQPHVQKGVAASNNPEARTYLDYRDLLADPKVEAVVIATPDHWHERMLLDAVEAGKDVYCEKGWTVSVEAAKRMRAAVRKQGRVMQLGHQGRQHAAVDVARRMIADGTLGDVTLVRTGRYLNAPRGQAPYRWYGWYSHYDRPDPAQVRRDLDWERWLGTAPAIEFDDRQFWHWRCYWAYGTGQAGDLLSHELDYVQAVLGHGIPDTCNCSGMIARWKDGRETPDTWVATYQFERIGRTVLFEGMMSSSRGQTPEFVGTEARLVCNEIGQSANQFEVYADGPAYVQSRYKQPEPTFAFVPGREHARSTHMENFVRCVRTREKPWCNEDEAFIECVTFLMSVRSHLEKRMVRWDPETETIV